MRAQLVAMLGLLAGACTSEGDFSEFIGTWTYNSGSSGVMTCPGSTATFNVGGNEEIRDGTESDVVVISSNGCNLKFNGAAGRIDAIPGQTCSSLIDGVTTSVTFNSASYNVSSGILALSGAGTARFTGPGGEVTCTLQVSGTLHKVAN